LEGNNACDIAIIGGGILGASLAYFLSSSSKSNILLIEQHGIASHTSSRNTGKVHAPFLYDPEKKKHFARAAFLGFDMWKKYCELHSLPFKQDGVLQVATNDKSVDRLYKYLKWGYSNGLKESELRFLEKEDVAKMEPNVKCLSAIYCSKDGSVNYGAMTRQLAEDAKGLGCNVMQSRVRRIERRNGQTLIHTEGGDVQADYVINAAGGNAVDIAHHMGAGQDYMAAFQGGILGGP
jgi:L-2-hydroxyglutarate oxidase